MFLEPIDSMGLAWAVSLRLVLRAGEAGRGFKADVVVSSN